MNKKLQFARIVMFAALAALTGLAQADDKPTDKERSLIEVLRSNAAPGDKAIACKQLAIYGSKESVPELAKLLTDKDLASWSRIALEAIPGPEADQALVEAMGKVQGRLLIGTINSIGVRKVAAAAEPLSARLQDKDAEAASAAAVALGHIASDAAIKSLRQALAGSQPKVRSAIAEGCVLCAERLLSDGKSAEAVEIYDEVRRAEVPKQRKLEATRGAIIARKTEGIPLLVEQLKSPDRAYFQIGLSTAREIPGREVAEALETEMVNATPERSALLLLALADRKDASASPAVLQAAASGPGKVRIAAIGVIGRLGDASCLSTLLESALESDAEIAEAAKGALIGLPGANVNAEIVARLAKAEGAAYPLLIELVGQRRIDARAELLKALDHANPAVRGAALTALGATIDFKGLSVLVSQVITPKAPEDEPAARQALRAASVRMADREATADELTLAMANAKTATKAAFLEILGDVGGAKALSTVADAAKSPDPELQDAGSRLLGAWMTADAGPVLLDLAKTAPDEKYQTRALRGYIRIARQFVLPDEQRAEMCRNAFKAARQPAEQRLVLEILPRYPSAEMLAIAVEAGNVPALKEDSAQATLAIIQKLGGKGADVKELLAKVGLEPVKVEIVKAEYGAGDKQKDVTEALRGRVSELPLITLAQPNYNAAFGGDPAPGVVKQLKIQYRINGKEAEATFAENAVVLLPLPK